jgi:Lipase C-terminal domain
VRTAAKKRLRGNGAWGPFKLERVAHYEFTISRSTSTHHLSCEPFQHDDDLIRLLTAEPNTGLDALTEKGDRHAVLIVTRNKELWGDQGAANDVLTINGTNVINAATSRSSSAPSGCSPSTPVRTDRATWARRCRRSSRCPSSAASVSRCPPYGRRTGGSRFDSGRGAAAGAGDQHPEPAVLHGPDLGAAQRLRVIA